MGDYGMSVSQKGYDTKTCADKFLAYSSAFQNLKVAGSYAVSTTKPLSEDYGGTDVNTITITHNLGYIAPFIVMYNGSSGTRGVGTSYFFFDGVVSWETVVLDAKNYANEFKLNISSNFDRTGAVVGDTVYFTVYIFADDFGTVAERNINTGATSVAPIDDYGMRISKEGYDAKTCTDDQLAFSSSFFNSIIHKKGITTVGTSTITHNLGYVPNFLLFEHTSDYSYNCCRFRLANANTTSITGLASFLKYAYIIFKNPIE